MTNKPNPTVPPQARPSQRPQSTSGRRARDTQATAAEPDLATTSGAPLPQPTLLERIRVTPLVDQHGSAYVQIADGGTQLVLPAQVIGNAAALGEALTQAGIPAYSPATRTGIQRLAERATAEPELRWIAPMPGWYAGAYVLPDGRVVGRCQHRLHVALPGLGVPLARAGNFAGWWLALRRFGTGQTNVVFAAAMGFAAAILDLLPYPGNLIVEAAGGGSQGKTTMGQLVASVSGGLMRTAGSLALSWQATVAGLEQPFLDRQFTCVPIDEANSAGSDVQARGRKVGEVTFLAAEGVSKLRYGDGRVINFWLALFSTANRSLADAARCSGAGQLELEALAPRLLTIPIDAGAGLGCWDTVPDRCAGPGDATDQFLARLNRHHGWALERFLEHLAAERRRDEAALKKRLLSYADQFLGEAGVPDTDGIARRRAAKFATIYAAGRLACEWGILPFEGVGASVMAVFRRAEALRGTAQVTAPPAAIDRIGQHAEARRADIVDLDAVEPPSLSGQALEQAPGFFKRFGGRRYLLVRSHQLERLFGIDLRRTLQELRAQGRLLASDKLQYQYRVRQETKHDRVYAIALDA